MKSSLHLLLALGTFGLVLGCPVYGVTPEHETHDELNWKIEYDDADRITAITDPAGRRTRMDYQFDASNRLRKLVRTSADGSAVSREFDERGRLVTMIDSGGVVSYGYDDLDRLHRVDRQGSAPVTYTYDTLDRVKTLQVGDFYRIEYEYDFLDRLASMDTPAGRVRYEYLTGQGKVVRTLPNGVKTIWEYSAEGTLRKITHGKTIDPNRNRYSLLAEYSYGYRPDGLIDTIKERSPAGELQRSYQYDTVGRLVRAKGRPRPQYVYGYDQVGNRTKTLSTVQPQRTFSYDWVGRLTHIEGAPTTHDAAGNLTSMTLGGKTWRYRYDDANQLVEAVNGKAGKTSYRYDGDGNLIERMAGRSNVAFIPDPLSDIWKPLIIEDNGTARTLVFWDDSAPLMMIRGGKPEYLLHDHLGSVRLVVNSQGKVTQRIDYEPYGVMEDNKAAQEFAPRFAGLFWEPRGHLYLAGIRTYSPLIGGFLQTDPYQPIPFGSQLDFSLYRYCRGDPLNSVDQGGLAPSVPSRLIGPITFPFYSKTFPEPLAGAVLRSAGAVLRYLDEGPGSTIKAGRQDQRVINEIIQTAWDVAPLEYGKYRSPESGEAKLAYSAARAAWMQIRYWRYNPEKYRAAFPEKRIPTASEWQAAEWRALARQYVVTGLVANAEGSTFNVRARPGTDAAIEMLTTHIPNWGVVHKLLQAAHIPPGMVPKLQGSKPKWAGQWLEVTPETETQAKIGVREGLEDYSAIKKAPGIDMKRLQKARSLADVIMKQIDTARDVIIKHEIGGGDWRVAGPGGRASRGAYAALREYAEKLGKSRPGPEIRIGKMPLLEMGKRRVDVGDTIKYVPLDYRRPDPDPLFIDHNNPRRPPPPPSLAAPSPVGGVYLGGAGQALNGFASIEGIAVDSNNNLILLDKAGKEIRLPPLRLDDVVTVFRSVYIHGESPTVSIDPNPENPEGSAMLIRHGKTTEGTYVGWVLFQADRLMKGYTLGADNDTGRQISSTVPGYDQVLSSIYFGGIAPEKLRKQGHWERFWIVFAKAHRFSGEKQELSLFDVPLKVKTQSMNWENGKLMDDPNGKSSPGALTFTDWFTAHYDQIAHERYLTPPPESGITEPVPVFTELRRIALITAIAEKLRDQGVPMPFWMRDYEIAPVPFETFTPGLEVTRSSGRTIARVYGGVQLSAEDMDVRDFSPGSDLSKLPQQDRAAVREEVALAASLEDIVRDKLKTIEPLEIRQFDHNGDEYQAVALPGAATQALAPARLQELDLSVPIKSGDAIQLVRSYNSFFKPKGPWGEGWALDLPRLEELRVPIRREGNQVFSQTAYELIAPLNSIYARFSRIDEVPALDNSRLMVPDQPASGQRSEFFGLADAEPPFLSGPTRKLIRKDGGAWHFDKAGKLVATEAGGLRTVYERDADGRLTRIVGLLGRKPMAFIELRYNPSGNLESATGRRADQDTDASKVRYKYDDSGRLTRVDSDAGRLGYRYQGPWVTAITFGHGSGFGSAANELVLRSFEYDARGQVLREVGADGAATDYRVAADADSRTVTATQVGSPSAAETIRYDLAYRPLQARYPDGSQAAWSYPDDGRTILDLTDDEGTAFGRLTESADRRQRTVDIEGDYRLASEYDDAGRLVSLAENRRPLLRQEWSPDGRLRKASTETQAEHYEYDPDGLMSRVVLAPPGEDAKLEQWQETRLDPLGRPMEITDYRGMNLSVSYDRSGEIKDLVTRREGKTLGFKITRDDAGRVQHIDSSWGKQHYAYDADGLLKDLKVEKAGATASAEWNAGLLRKIQQFDGGDLSLTYFEDGDQAGLLKGITTPNELELAYRYDQGDRLAEVDVGNRFRMLLDYDADGRLAGWRYRPAGR